MNDISFTGLHNIKVLKKFETRFGPYLPPNHSQIKTETIPMKHGEKHYKRVVIECDITDDAAGSDFAEFEKALKNSGIIGKESKAPSHIKLAMDRFDVDDEVGKVTESCFKINDIDIPLNNREKLPIYTFMAYLTRKLQTLQGISEEKIKFFRLVNESVHKKATDFIENIM